MKSFIINNGIVIIMGAVINVVNCRFNSFCRFDAESLAV